MLPSAVNIILRDFLEVARYHILNVLVITPLPFRTRTLTLGVGLMLFLLTAITGLGSTFGH